MRGKKLIIAAAMAVVLLSGFYFAYAHWFGSTENSREHLLKALPTDASAVIYLDVAELRQGALLKNLAGWSAGATVEPEYKQFVSETGFDYEKDLDRVGIAIQNAGAGNHYFALADGKFDRKKIEAYLRKSAVVEKKGTLEIFHLAGTNSNPYISSVEHWISIAFLSDHRVVISDAANLQVQLQSAANAAGHTEWMERFARLAGSPMFAVVRQDAAIGAILNAQAPGGIRSPQLMQLLNQLLWVSIAGKPDGPQFRVVVEGECPNEATMRQLSDFLNGITLMAQSGLNDPKLRQKMDPAEREAYLQLLGSIDVAKLDRGTGKSVRLVLQITPSLWERAIAQEVKTKAGMSSPAAPAKEPPKSKPSH